MTLSTEIYVLEPVDVRELFAECQRLLAAADEIPDRPQKSKEGGSWRGDGSARLLENLVGQGLPAWLMVHYREDGPLVTAEQAAEHDEDCSEECTGKYHDQPCHLLIDIDTAYSYRSARGGCGDLHAWYIAELSKWLAARNVPFRWQNEFTGDVYDGLAGLDTLASGGRAAGNWFANEVLPMIAAQVAASGGELAP